jgi:hypothetical protein
VTTSGSGEIVGVIRLANKVNTAAIATCSEIEPTSDKRTT